VGGWQVPVPSLCGGYVDVREQVLARRGPGCMLQHGIQGVSTHLIGDPEKW
jgi:hypothetical protein